MTRAGLLRCALLLIVMAPMTGHAQDNENQYVSPPHAIPHGAAPGMQVQLLNREGKPKEYAVIFAKGDEALSGLTEFANRYHVTSAHFTAIGAVNRAEIAWFDPRRKMYKKIPIEGPHEVVSLIGDIALYNGKPIVHTHMVVADEDGTTLGGHVLSMEVFPTLEVMITVDPIAMQKRFDPDTDLTLITPALPHH